VAIGCLRKQGLMPSAATAVRRLAYSAIHHQWRQRDAITLLAAALLPLGASRRRQWVADAATFDTRAAIVLPPRNGATAKHGGCAAAMVAIATPLEIHGIHGAARQKMGGKRWR